MAQTQARMSVGTCRVDTVGHESTHYIGVSEGTVYFDACGAIVTWRYRMQKWAFHDGAADIEPAFGRFCSPDGGDSQCVDGGSPTTTITVTVLGAQTRQDLALGLVEETTPPEMVGRTGSGAEYLFHRHVEFGPAIAAPVVPRELV